MSRPRLELAEPIHRSACRVIYGDTDAGRFVYYANYYRYFEFARAEFMRDWVLPYSQIEEMGFILPVVESYCRYKAPARFDDLLVIETSLIEVTPHTCRFHYRIQREADGKLLVRGFTVHAVINGEGKLTRLPDAVLEKLTPLVAATAGT